MARPYIEFIQSQHLAWRPSPMAGVDWKVLSEDDDSGAVTALLRFPVGRTPWTGRSADWELFVLSGALQLGTAHVGMHFYAYLPGESAPATIETGSAGAVVLSFFSGPPIASTARPPAGEAIAPIDTTALRWDDSGIDPQINHLHAARKNLRLAPDGTCRTYLLGGRPQGFPYGGAALETHPHAEEFFMVSGDMPCHVGVMRTGAYFYRPPGIAHGRDCTRSGYLLFCRTPGSNRTISEWSEERYPVSFEPEHRTVAPPELAAAARPIADPLVY
jgi:hypothetical protein